MAKATADLKLAPGDKAPSFQLKGTDGKSHSLADFADFDAVLIVFTCNHCPYAKAKHPVLNDIEHRFDDLAVIGINPNNNDAYPEDSFNRMVERVESGDIQFSSYLFDETQSVAKAYGAVCTPDPFLFGREDGEFVLRYHGRLDDAMNPEDEPSGEPGAEIRSAIDSVLQDEPIEQEQQPSQGCSIKWQDGNEPEYWNEI
jgi:peroxiredoxin